MLLLAAAILAQVEHVPASTLKDVMLLAIGGIGAAVGLKSLFWPAPTRLQPPVEVTHGTEYVTKAEWAQFRDGLSLRLDRIEEDIASLRSSVRDEFAESRGSHEGGLQRVHARIDDLPAQIIATLRNTGAIRP